MKYKIRTLKEASLYGARMGDLIDLPDKKIKKQKIKEEDSYDSGQMEG